jgi:hypothetical protein
MERTMHGPVVGLVALTGLLAAIASGAGVFLRGDLATEVFTTFRGEAVDLLTGGVYRFNGEAVAAEGVGWDAVTLFLVVPALFLTLPALRRGSVRALLLATGILAYFLYQYAEYATFLAYGPLFLLYVATFALSLTGIALLVSELELDVLAAGVDGRFPRRAATVFGLFVAILLAGMWLPLIVRSFGQAVVPELDGATTLVVQAFDLGFLVPLGLFTAVTVWRRLPVGYVLAAVLVVKGAAMGAGIAAMLIVEAMVTDVLQIVPIALFALISLTSLALGVRVYGSIDALPHLAGTPTTGRMAHRAAHG